MDTTSLAALLEREHHDIDGGFDRFLTSLTSLTESASPPDVDSASRAIDALRRHIYLEEEVLFPPLRAAGLFAAILVMLREHGQIWGLLDTLASEMEKDPRADVVRETCSELLTLLDAHNAKEEPIIYPKADADLPADAQEHLREFLATGQMPSGWTCAQA